MFLIFVPFCFASSSTFVCHLEGVRYDSPSLCRCISSILYGFTDKPPFDGKSVELHFSADYNETELEEAVHLLGPERILESDIGCGRKKRESEDWTRKREKIDQERDQKWKEEVEAQDMEKKCKYAIVELEKRNSVKWFWQAKEVPEWITNPQCPCYRQNEWIDPKNQEWVWQVNEHPCIELECLKEGGPLRKRERCSYSTLNGLKGDDTPCVNTIKLRI